MTTRIPSRLRTLLLLAATLVVLSAACAGNGDTESAEDTTTTSPDTTTTTDTDTTTTEDLPGEQIEVFELGAGECFDERLVAGQGKVEVDELFRVPCDGPHQNEVYKLATMTQGGDEAYPGEDAVREFANTTCLEGFADFIGVQYELSDFELAYVIPTESSWPRPDREVVCFVFDRSGDPVDGSAAGAGR